MPDQYDIVKYPNFPRNQTHPAHVAAIATIAGVELPPAGRWRVLEIGCGTAANLIPFAHDFPDAEFVGIDRAREPLEEGRALASDLHLANLKLEQADLLNWQPTGNFDYIIAHGFFSWVPPEVREKIFQVCAQTLTAQGIAFISYNALPGCHFRRFTRDLLRFHVRHETEPGRRVEKAREFAQIVADMPGDEPLQLGIRHEFETLLKRDAAALYHDDLAETNDPFYLLDFVAEAAKHDLQYLGDADPVRDDLQGQSALAEDWIEARQYVDFLTIRRFRETLLCRKGIPIDRKLSLERFRRLFAACHMKPGEIKEDGTQVFQFPGSGTLATNHPLARKLLCDLGGIWPHAIQLRDFSCDEYTPDSVAEMLMRLFRNKVIELRALPPNLAASITERPQISFLARAQLARGDTAVTNQRHQYVELSDKMIRTFLTLLDGSRDRATLIREMVKFGSDPESTDSILNAGLLEMHRMCLLIG